MKCPGQDMQYWRDDAIFEVDCPKCAASVEFYKDDTSRKCGNCGHRFVNPQLDFGCASYCQFAEQCLGTLPEDFKGSKQDLLKDKIAVEVKRYFHTDFKSIKKATNLARFAEIIGKKEGGNLSVLLCAAYLHGIPENDVLTILAKVDAAENLIAQICSILGFQTKKAVEDILTRKIITDALILHSLQQTVKNDSEKKEIFLAKLKTAIQTPAAKMLFEEFVEDLIFLQPKRTS